MNFKAAICVERELASEHLSMSAGWQVRAAEKLLKGESERQDSESDQATEEDIKESQYVGLIRSVSGIQV